MSIKCGNCDQRHNSVDEVKACYRKLVPGLEDDFNREWASMKDLGARREAEQERDAYRAKMERDEELVAAQTLDRMQGKRNGQEPLEEAPAFKPPPPSMAQVNYVMDLLRQHEWPDEITKDDIMGMERRQVSNLIVRIKGSPRKKSVASKEPMPDVPAGRYATLSTHPNPDDNSESADYDFWQVDRPTEGKWAGHTFLRQLFGAPGDYHKVDVRGGPARKVLEKIAADPEKASLTYGRVSEVCGVCHSPLTNKESRDAGIGPVCARKTGWGA